MNIHHTVYDVYSFRKSITPEEIKAHLECLLKITPDKKRTVFLINARTHTNATMQEFYLERKSQLQMVFLTRYSPYINNHENSGQLY